MSSLRNAVKRITHKERSQPQDRAQLGILEKKKDYKARALNYHRKEDRIQAMRQKASFRNPDEFYFGMKNSEIKDGQHRKTQEAQQKEMEDQIGADAVRIMKDQDLSYVRMQKQLDAKKIERLKASLHFVGGDDNSTRKRKHTIFVQSKDEAEKFNVADHFDTLPEFTGRAFNRPRKEALLKEALRSSGYGSEDDEHATDTNQARPSKMAKRSAKKVAKARASAYRELEDRSRRVATLERAEAHLVTEKLLAGKGRKRKLKPAEDGQL